LFQYQSYSLFCVDSCGVFTCYDLYCGFKDIKTTNSAAAVLSGQVGLFSPVLGLNVETLHILFMSGIWSICMDCIILRHVVVPQNMPCTFSSLLEYFINLHRLQTLSLPRNLKPSIHHSSRHNKARGIGW
jgi:hypothetical protein